MNKYYLGALGLLAVYFGVKLLKVLLFRGFAPWLPLKGAETAAIVAELNKERLVKNPVVYSLGSGKSGFLFFLAKMMPEASLFAVENQFWLYLLEKIQLLLRFSPIKLEFRKKLYSLKMSEMDLIYLDLSIEELTELPRKFKFECRQGTIILSVANPIPNLEEKRGFDLPAPISLRSRLMFWRKQVETVAKKEGGATWVYLYVI